MNQLKRETRSRQASFNSIATWHSGDGIGKMIVTQSVRNTFSIINIHLTIMHLFSFFIHAAKFFFSNGFEWKWQILVLVKLNQLCDSVDIFADSD